MYVLIESRFIVEIPPTKMSTTVKFITKYMPWVRRLLFFMKRMIDSRFTVTIATATARNAANQIMHSDEENIVDFSFRFPPFNSRLLSGSATYEKNSLSKQGLLSWRREWLQILKDLQWRYIQRALTSILIQLFLDVVPKIESKVLLSPLEKKKQM